jgi:hypothetical protein
MSSITIAASRIYPKASLSPSERLVNCKKQHIKKSNQAYYKKGKVQYIKEKSEMSNLHALPAIEVSN